jgi:cell division transport system ATP-binding protein
MSLITFENVGLRYSTGPEILTDVSFDLAPGSFHFLTGPSGAGKTSLMKLLYLGQKPTRGSIKIMDRDILGLSRGQVTRLRRQIGIVFQNFRLLNHLSAFDNVALPLRATGMDEHKIRKNVIELLEWVGLGDCLHALPVTLSGGEQQRVAIARAIINRPKILLADEPTGNVDRKIGMKLLYLFEELNRLGTTIVIATHDQEIIEQFDRPVLRMENGHVHQSLDGLRSSLSSMPENPL